MSVDGAGVGQQGGAAGWVQTLTLMPLCLYRSTQQMPQLFQWLSYLTFQKYSCELLIVTEFHGLTFTCSEFVHTQGADTGQTGTPSSRWRHRLPVIYQSEPAHLTKELLPWLLSLYMLTYQNNSGLEIRLDYIRLQSVHNRSSITVQGHDSSLRRP